MDNNHDVVAWNASDVYGWMAMFAIIGVVIAFSPLYWLVVVTVEVGKAINTNLALYGLPVVAVLIAVVLFFLMSKALRISPMKLWILWLIASLPIGGVLAYLFPEISSLQLYPRLFQSCMDWLAHAWHWMGSEPGV